MQPTHSLDLREINLRTHHCLWVCDILEAQNLYKNLQIFNQDLYAVTNSYIRATYTQKSTIIRTRKSSDA